jgi:hypothetical protein
MMKTENGGYMFQLTKRDAVILAVSFRQMQDDLVSDIKRLKADLERGPDPVMGWMGDSAERIKTEIENCTQAHYNLTNRLNELQNEFGVGGRRSPEIALRDDIMVEDRSDIV